MATDPTAAARPDAPCLELAVYTVHASEADTLPARQAAMHEALRARPGFERGERLRGLDDPTLFADYIRWASRAEAAAEAARLPELPGAGAFMGAIAAMRTMAHLPVGAPTGGPAAAAPMPAGAPAGSADAR
jgi:hypothetical protein